MPKKNSIHEHEPPPPSYFSGFHLRALENFFLHVSSMRMKLVGAASTGCGKLADRAAGKRENEPDKVGQLAAGRNNSCKLCNDCVDASKLADLAGFQHASASRRKRDGEETRRERVSILAQVA